MYSFDSKFWKTLIPLLLKPGKVSKDFIEGKRQRYNNPFQFYLTISIMFFITLGIFNKYDEFNSFRQGTVKDSNTQKASFKANFDPTGAVLDSIRKGSTEGMKAALKDLDSTEKAETEKALKTLGFNLKDNKKDSTNNTKKDSTKNVLIPKETSGKGWQMTSDSNRFNKMFEYQKQNPDALMDDALDSLQLKKNLTNRFLYSRAGAIKKLSENPAEEVKKIGDELLSYATISIFIFLPFFSLFLKLLYIRRKFTYVDHLVFIFHTQTVFFLLLWIFFVLGKFTNAGSNFVWIFLLLFAIYLILAMKKFYQQGLFKTLIKLFVLNQIYIIMASFGLMIVSLIAFALY